MLLFYIRHGDPIYDPDQLTPLGKRQAESVAKRLALFGIDNVFSSDSIRAQETAQPTCELLGLEKTILPEFHESLAFADLSVCREESGKKVWPWSHPEVRRLFLSREVRSLGDRFYEHPALRRYKDFGAALERMNKATDDFLSSLGYHHDPEAGRYTVTSENPNERIALFAHEGVAKLMLSRILDIPFPLYAINFEMEHSGMTVIEFRTWKDGTTSARVLTLSNDSHLYRDGLPLDYKHSVRF